MKHLENFKRSINIWKVSDKDKEAMNIYVDMYLFMNELFKDLIINISDGHPLITNYSNSQNDIILVENLETNCNYICYYKVISPFKSTYKNIIDKYLDILDILDEYIKNYLHLKGRRTFIID